MTTLFRRIQPAQKLRITVYTIAKLLGIPQSMIVRVKCWAYVVFVHRLDRGGQFISYRQLQVWQNAIACQIQNCSTCLGLDKLWQAIQHSWAVFLPSHLLRLTGGEWRSGTTGETTDLQHIGEDALLVTPPQLATK